ncbi:hypothetical protein QR680_016688 [Steinernema hermaphroditum]|uniref:Uncharacterized protein n=1 Tax=Steinernema hermaphroditum TaxID=289476 RepID=A0AA39LMZ0_9BILA|nr:hypothetical protein QR680_016688 [Steinernema hermaphroditum]
MASPEEGREIGTWHNFGIFERKYKRSRRWEISDMRLLDLRGTVGKKVIGERKPFDSALRSVGGKGRNYSQDLEFAQYSEIQKTPSGNAPVIYENLRETHLIVEPPPPPSAPWLSAPRREEASGPRYRPPPPRSPPFGLLVTFLSFQAPSLHDAATRRSGNSRLSNSIHI